MCDRAHTEKVAWSNYLHGSIAINHTSIIELLDFVQDICILPYAYLFGNKQDMSNYLNQTQ